MDFNNEARLAPAMFAILPGRGPNRSAHGSRESSRLASATDTIRRRALP
jgi:hypothetical protein